MEGSSGQYFDCAKKLKSLPQSFNSTGLVLVLYQSPLKPRLPQIMQRLKPKHAYLLANGDLRLSANQKCWPEQAKMEAILTKALKAEGRNVVRAHPFDKQKQHGFIDSQKMGMAVFRKLDPDVPLIIAECVWQYSHHVLGGLLTHRGP